MENSKIFKNFLSFFFKSKKKEIEEEPHSLLALQSELETKMHLLQKNLLLLGSIFLGLIQSTPTGWPRKHEIEDKSALISSIIAPMTTSGPPQPDKKSVMAGRRITMKYEMGAPVLTGPVNLYCRSHIPKENFHTFESIQLNEQSLQIFTMSPSMRTKKQF